jgi:hypothetical protein
MILPVHATLDLPARDVRGGTLILEAVRCLDIVASRKFAAVRHAGELVERPGIADEFHLDQLPRIIRLK